MVKTDFSYKAFVHVNKIEDIYFVELYLGPLHQWWNNQNLCGGTLQLSTQLAMLVLLVNVSNESTD
jgi:hypothetical protein